MLIDYQSLKLGRKLTDQQLWCLGCDVRTSGFPWRELGWRYLPRPDKTRGCGRLIAPLPRGGNLSIWGFGYLASDTTHGAIWIGRKEIRPRWRNGFDPATLLWELHQVPAFRPPAGPDQTLSAAFLLAELAERLSEHERDVQALLGAAYRNACVKSWRFHRTALPSGDMAGSWSRIAAEARNFQQRHPSPLAA